MTFREKAGLAEMAARAAGDLLERAHGFQVMRKSENDFVTEMDFQSERLIRGILLDACPEDQFFGEETGGALRADGRWIVDPVDGTFNYLRSQRLYSISIAYEHRGELVVGCVYCPGTSEMFTGVKGEGAARNGRPIHVSGTARLRDALVSLGFGHRVPANLRRTLEVFPALISSVSDVRRSGTAAYDLCCVARGASDAFVELGLSLYDYAAGYVILKEAGGTFSGWEDGEDGLSSGNLIASNGLLHEPLRAILAHRN